MIVIADYGMGNMVSIGNAIERLGRSYRISSDPSDIKNADYLILPGVGSFSTAMKRLNNSGMANSITDYAIEQKKPVLGICLGMQLMGSSSTEGGFSKGLGLVRNSIQHLSIESPDLVIPHVGFNNVFHNDSNFFHKIPSGKDFYFTHSYAMKPEDSQIEYATCNYGYDFVAAFRKDNIYGAQFHPEKSQDIGLQFLKNFMEA